MERFDLWLEAYPRSALLVSLALAALVGVALHFVLHAIAVRAAHRYALAERLVHYTRRVAQVLLPVLLMQGALSDQAAVPPWLHHLFSVAVIVLVTVLCARLVQALADHTLSQHPIETSSDVNRARRLQTQVRVFARSSMFVIGLLGAGSVLMTFPSVRQVGASLLASAGLAGIVVGFAAKPVLSNFIAGLQIAFTQPIRIDDVLIVEGEWGRVEEITGSYVVFRIWDNRRMIVPLDWFTTKPFQNWTHVSPELLGTVFLWVDCRMDVAPLRAELKRLCEASALWDKRVCLLQVTDMTERAMQLRCLVSSADAGTGFDLRCEVREGLIAYMQRHYPEWLPSVRLAITVPGDGSPPLAEPPSRAAPPAPPRVVGTTSH